MIKSMTGYGSARGTSGKLELTVELKSVNNRFFDCTIKLPRVYAVLEDSVRSRIQARIFRGKVDVFITVDTSGADDVIISLNKSLADAYYEVTKQISERYGIPNGLSARAMAQFPDVLVMKHKETDIDGMREDLLKTVDFALDDLEAMRLREGEKLRLDMSCHIDEIERLVTMAEERSPRTVEAYRERLTKRMRDVLENTKIDEARILTEAAIFADRVSVNEETVRLHSHAAQFKKLLESDKPAGKKMDFLVQEFNREANTLGAKGNDIEMAKIVVDMKSEIEKLREQVQNIE